jgi:hypothetical protein
VTTRSGGDVRMVSVDASTSEVPPCTSECAFPS